MGMVVRTNVMSINANRQLNQNNNKVGKSLEKLASGFRINRAGDDASGLAISEKMKAQIKGLDQAAANAQDGISLVQTAEGALTEVHDMLNRMVTLATKSANGTIQNEVDREAIQSEVDALNSEITRISQSTNFNGINLLDGSLSSTGVAGSPLSSGKVKILLSEAAKAAGAYQYTASTSGQFVSKAVTGNAAITAGDSFSLNVIYNNGSENVTKTITLTAISANKLQANDGTGTVYELTAAGNATNAEVTAAFKDQLTKSELSDMFKITEASQIFTFDSKESGANAPSIISIVETENVSGVYAEKMSGLTTNAPGADGYDQLDITQFASWDGADINDLDVFEINGSKFAFVDDTLTADQRAMLSPDITAIDFTSTVADDETAAINAIANKTGLSVSGDTNGLINLKVKTGSTAGSVGGLTLQIGDTNDKFNKVTVSVDNLSASGIGTAGLNVSDQDSAGNAIKTIKAAINKVSTNRANLGALQNRLEYTINNLEITSENMTAANSRIRDTDMAKEMMEYTKMSILTQSAQAMLAQANQQPQSILQLLQ